jgi:hypothetical protein
MVPYEATMVGFGGAMVSFIVWGVPNNTRQKIEIQMFLGIKWPKLNKKDSTASRQ